MSLAMENGYEIGNVECEESLITGLLWLRIRTIGGLLLRQ
jgi:hypothetical protein